MKTEGRQSSEGFSLLEAVAALAVLGLLAGALFHSQIELLRAGSKIRVIEESACVASCVAAESRLGRSPVAMVAAGENGWNLDWQPVETHAGTNAFVWDRWAVAPSNATAPVMVFYLRRVPGGATSPPAANP